jgi:hypothetical protein
MVSILFGFTKKDQLKIILCLLQKASTGSGFDRLSLTDPWNCISMPSGWIFK